MNRNRLSEKSVFKLAHSLESTDLRNEYLDQVCGDDPTLRDRVALLLQMQAEEPDFLESPAATVNVTSDLPGAVLGSCIGPYKLREQMGEGGMGIVYVAEQSQPVRRKVALKVIKPGMSTKDVVARFQAERQALALMDHPNIARVFDGGATESGLPFFVMELVQGLPITHYCDTRRLDTTERLKLCVKVCQAVQHAHQKGIIHRDLKPSNVLVAEIDGAAVPKVIDFGIAKAVNQKLSDQTAYTQFFQIVGTPLYMSPEQAGLGVIDIDTRSDVYSLGVMLYELLTGSTPFDSETLKRSGVDEIRRIIQEQEPARPSRHVATLAAEALSTVAERRGVDPRKLSATLSGELDWIVLKCLEKDRTRRYDSASALAADLERHFADEPVEASPPSAVYRLRKFARRHRTAAITTLVVTLSLILGTAVSTWQAVRATRAERDAIAAWVAEAQQRQQSEHQRNRAVDAEKMALRSADAERKAKETARTREVETQAVLDFVENKIFAAARPEGQDGGLGNQVTLRQVLDAALPFLETSLSDQPLVEARLRRTLGNSFRLLGEAGMAAEQDQAALTIFTKHRGPDHADTLGCMVNLANDYQDLSQHAEALRLYEATLAVMKVKIPDHAFTLNCMDGLANTYHKLGRYADALKFHEQTLALRQAKQGPNHPDTLWTMNNLATSYREFGRYAEAAALYEAILTHWKDSLPAGHPDMLGIMHNLAISYHDLGRHADALTLNEETLALRTAKLSAGHPDTLASMNNLALSYDALDRPNDALKLREQTLALVKAKLGSDHSVTLACMVNLAISYQNLGRHADALKLHEETLALLKANLGPDHANTLGCMVNLAMDYRNVGRLADAISLYESTLAVMKVKIPEHQFTLNCMNNLAAGYTGLGRHADALKLREETLALRESKLGAGHPSTLMSMSNLASSYAAVGRHGDAITLFEKTLLLINNSQLESDHHQKLWTMNDLAWLLANCPDPAFRHPGRALELAKTLVELSPHAGRYWNTLGVAHYRAGNWQAALAALENSTQLSGGGDGFDLFFQAMAEWQLDAKTKGRMLYARAVEWMEKNQPRDEELLRCRAEAAELLGIAEKSQPETEPAPK